MPICPVPSGAANAGCPRCGKLFHCGAADTSPCVCSTLELSEALLTTLRLRYEGCLCIGCLQELAGDEAAPEDVASRTPGP